MRRRRTASARSNWRAASARRRGYRRRSSVRPPGSSRAPAPALEHSDRVPESSRRASTCLPGAFFPAAALLQGVDHLTRHITFIMLGEHHIGHDAAGLELALGDHALPFPEQVWHDALIAHRYVALAVGDLEADVQVLAALHAAGLDQSADANPRAHRHMLFGN